MYSAMFNITYCSLGETLFKGMIGQGKMVLIDLILAFDQYIFIRQLK